MTRTGPSARALRSASTGSATDSTCSKYGSARAASSCSARARGLLLRVATKIVPPRTGARAWRRRPCRAGSTRRSSTRGAPAVRAATRRPRSCARRRGPRRGRAARACPAARSRPPPRSDDRRTPRRPRGRRRRGRGHRARGRATRRPAGRRRAGDDDRELLARDLVARVPEDVRVLETDVRQEHDGSVEHVRRVEPPAEARFDDGRRDAAFGEARERGRGERLELRRADGLGRGTDVGDRALERGGSVSRRSCQPLTCGEVYTPTSRPSARNSAAMVRAAVDLPFVPTTCTDANARCGLPSASSSARILPRPNSAGHGDSDATHSVAVNEEAGSGTRAARRSRRARTARPRARCSSRPGGASACSRARRPNARARAGSRARGRVAARPAP